MEASAVRRNLPLVIGGALALVAGLVIAGTLVFKHRGEKPPPAPASQGGLVIETTSPSEGKLESAKPLRCFVGGKFVGEMTLGDCARRNGVATGGLDVGVDDTGQLAAANPNGVVLTPLPPAGVAPSAVPIGPASAGTASAAPSGSCWRHDDGNWRRLPSDMTLNACVQTLFASRCEKPGGASYGRWMQQTLRLVPGRVEVSADNRSFHTLVEQGAGCAIPPVG
jgi:hypothetical protein